MTIENIGSSNIFVRVVKSKINNRMFQNPRRSSYGGWLCNSYYIWSLEDQRHLFEELALVLL